MKKKKQVHLLQFYEIYILQMTSHFHTKTLYVQFWPWPKKFMYSTQNLKLINKKSKLSKIICKIPKLHLKRTFSKNTNSMGQETERTVKFWWFKSDSSLVIYTHTQLGLESLTSTPTLLFQSLLFQS